MKRSFAVLLCLSAILALTCCTKPEKAEDAAISADSSQIVSDETSRESDNTDSVDANKPSEDSGTDIAASPVNAPVNEPVDKKEAAETDEKNDLQIKNADEKADKTSDENIPETPSDSKQPVSSFVPSDGSTKNDPQYVYEASDTLEASQDPKSEVSENEPSAEGAESVEDEIVHPDTGIHKTTDDPNDERVIVLPTVEF